MLEKVILEILKIKGIIRPYSYYGAYEYQQMRDFLKKNNRMWKHLSVIKRYAKIWDLPVSFIISIMNMEAIDEQEIK